MPLWLATQARALVRNRTRDLSVPRLVLSVWSHTSQGIDLSSCFCSFPSCFSASEGMDPPFRQTPSVGIAFRVDGLDASPRPNSQPSIVQGAVAAGSEHCRQEALTLLLRRNGFPQSCWRVMGLDGGPWVV